MNERNVMLIEHINKHYKELLEELKLVDSFECFLKGGPIVKAIQMDIIQIAENINSLTDDFSAHLNPKDLRGIADIRNHVVHGYASVDDEIVWKTIQIKLPKLIDDINSIR